MIYFEAVFRETVFRIRQSTWVLSAVEIVDGQKDKKQVHGGNEDDLNLSCFYFCLYRPNNHLCLIAPYWGKLWIKLLAKPDFVRYVLC